MEGNYNCKCSPKNINYFISISEQRVKGEYVLTEVTTLQCHQGRIWEYCEVMQPSSWVPRQCWIKFQRDRCIRRVTVTTSNVGLGCRRNIFKYQSPLDIKMLFPQRRGHSATAKHQSH